MSGEIEHEVREVVGILLAQLDPPPRSVVWHGGFARGEGGCYDYRGRRLPFGDYDLEAVCDRPPTAAQRARVDRALLERFGYRPVTADPAPTWRDDADTFNVIDLKYTPTARFAARPADLATCDFVHGSRVLHGEDLRPRIALAPERISPMSPFRILNNRLAALLPVAKARLWSGAGTFQEYVAYELALVRVALDLGLCLSFTLGCYATSTCERLARLARCRADLERETGAAGPLLAFLAQAAERKNSPAISTDGGAARRLWFDTLDHAWTVLSWLGWKLLLSPNASVPRYAREVQRRLPARFYRAYLEHDLRRLGVPLAPVLARGLARLPNPVENLRWRGAAFLLRHPLGSWRSPAVRAASAVPLVLYALRRDGTVDARCLRRARELVSVYDATFPVEPTLAAWDAARAALGALLSDWRAGKGADRTLTSGG